MHPQLHAILERIIALLAQCGWEKQSLWFAQKRDALLQSEDQSPEYVALLRELRRVIRGGMGSFSDIPLRPKTGDRTELQVHREQVALNDELWRVIEVELDSEGDHSAH